MARLKAAGELSAKLETGHCRLASGYRLCSKLETVARIDCSYAGGRKGSCLSCKLETAAMLGDGRTAVYAVNWTLEAVDLKAWLGRGSRLCPKLEAGRWKLEGMAWQGL